MGIYISGVKGLPEQVQENKNKIKEVEEQIEGIDFDAVRQLQDQVAENTQDINNLEASIGVQNQAINTLNNDVDALESKTQLMSYNDDLSKTDFRNSIDVADAVYSTSLNVVGDGTMVNANGSGLHFQEGANDDTLTIANNDGAVQHFLHFNADGTLDIDGTPVGGGATYYQHNISITYNAGGQFLNITLNYIDTHVEAATGSAVYNYLRLNGFADNTNVYSIAGLERYSGGELHIINAAYCDSNRIYLGWYDTTSSSYSFNYFTVSTLTVRDRVVQIA